MSGRATQAQIAAFIVAIRAKGETAEEMTGLVEGMLDAAVTVDIGEPVVDTAGTGGDASGTFNISTTAALIAAGAGAKIAKHGNRAASSKTGSADLLEALGVRLDLPPEVTVQMVREIGFGFFFAPAYHPAMRHAGPVRRELGVRTVFNFLGPLGQPGSGHAPGAWGFRPPHGRTDDPGAGEPRGRGRLCLSRRGWPRRADNDGPVVHLPPQGRGDHPRRVHSRGLWRGAGHAR